MRVALVVIRTGEEPWLKLQGKPVLVTHWLGYPTHCDSWHSIWKITVLENWAGLSLIYVEINTNKK